MSSPSSSSEFNKHLIRQCEIVHGMIDRLAEDFTDEEATKPTGNFKPLVWYLGHVAVTDNYFLTLYGAHESALSDEHMKRFGRGSDGHADFSDASKAEMLGLLGTLRDRLKATLSALEVDDLAREAGRDVGHPLFATLGSALALTVAHAGYHAGQIADLRKAMGKDPIFG